MTLSMKLNRLRDMLEEYGTLLTDGAMGTMLFEAGLEFGDPPELWNVEHPEVVNSIQSAYAHSGSHLLLTNTFGGSRFRLRQHGLQDRKHELNRSGAANLRGTIDALGMPCLVAGDIGPSGEIMAPLGELDFEDAVVGFAEQCDGLIEGGADLIWIETLSSLEEMTAAVLGVQQINPRIPIITCMSFDTHGRTMMGVTPEDAILTMLDLGVFAGGGNCGSGTTEMLEVVERMHAAAPDAVLVAKSNAGVPELEDGKAVYRAGPETMAEFAVAAQARGARIIGGCCGTRPEHIEAMGAALRATAPKDNSETNTIRITEKAKSSSRVVAVRKRRRVRGTKRGGEESNR